MFYFKFDTTTLKPTSYDFNFGKNKRIFYTLLGITNNIISVWTSIDASLDNGVMYIGSKDSLNIISLESKACIDYYTTTHSGIAGEALDGSNITDINVVS